uniref:Uncharacterized protein n=1 Tax=Nelumbo nucifera TaxID=4432 RepID=A0A822XJ29_NELNU|nr:TPA_asm: hypothetical protein HUJ06_021176 [Nelumbo nucifera]
MCIGLVFRVANTLTIRINSEWPCLTENSLPRDLIQSLHHKMFSSIHISPL